MECSAASTYKLDPHHSRKEHALMLKNWTTNFGKLNGTEIKEILNQNWELSTFLHRVPLERCSTK